MTEERGRASVLITEDDPALAALYRAWLRPTYCVEIAATGEEALEQMREAPTDVVLLDRHLPDISGDEVLTVLRDRGYDQPVAMVTAISPDFDVLDLGFDEYLTKPVEKDGLHKTVENLVDARSLVDLHRSLSTKKVKRNVLQLEHSESELAANEEYTQLIHEIERLETRLARRRTRTRPQTAD